MYKAEKIKGIFYLDISKVWSSHIENYVSLLTQILLLYLDTLTANSDINVCFYYFNCRSKDKDLELIDKFQEILYAIRINSYWKSIQYLPNCNFCNYQNSVENYEVT